VNVHLYITRNCFFPLQKKLICLFSKDYYRRFLQYCRLSLVSLQSHNFICSPHWYYVLWHIIIHGGGVVYRGKTFAWCHKNNLTRSRFITEELISFLLKHGKLYSKLISIPYTISSVIVLLTEGFVALCTVYSFRCVLCI